ncbi:MAG: ribbon-helix-helix domain-containing protein [Actinomycetota bacterium]
MARNQTLVQLTDELVAALDQHAALAGRSRSDLIRTAVERYLSEGMNAEVDRAIVEGYSRIPQGPDPWAEAAARDSIAAEPW